MFSQDSLENLIGRTLQGYRIDRFVARGGMGVVFVATQESLGRQVAVKILYPHLSADSQFRERFEREARAAARLIHPNIVRVLDFGVVDGLYFMVQDFIDGESLRDRLVRVASDGTMLRPAAAVDYVEQIAGALSYAHRAGYVHRDVKPGNILLAHDGQASLADFGLVKILGESQLTAQGLIIGTPEYMAPEQGSGSGEIGPAADQYSLAVVAYELLVGRVPFKATTPVSVMRMHLTDPPPDPRTIAPWFPEPVAGVLVRALAKQPGQRFESVDAFAAALLTATGTAPRAASALPADAAEAATAATAVPAAQPVTPAEAVTPLPAPRPFTAAGAATPTPFPQPSTGDDAAMATQVPAPNVPGDAALPAQTPPPVTPAPAVMPSQAAGATPPPAIPPSPAAPGSLPPNGSTRRYALPALGGGLVALALLLAVGGFLLRGHLFGASGDGHGGAAAGASPTATTLPTVVALASATPTAESTASVAATATGTSEATPVAPAVVPPGMIPVIVFASARGGVHSSQIFIMNMDGSDQRQLTASQGHTWAPAVSPDGTKLMFSTVIGHHTHSDPSGGALTGETNNHDVYVADLTGTSVASLQSINLENLTADSPAWDNGWSWSPDSKRIAFSSDRDGNYEIYTMAADGSDVQRLTDTPASDGWPVYTPGGRSIVFSSDRTGNEEIFIMDADGGNARQLTNRPDTFDVFPSVSPDGKLIAFSSQVPGIDQGAIYVMNIDGSNLHRVTNAAALDNIPSWCPDGQQIVFMSNRDGNPNGNIYIMSADGSKVTRLTSTDTQQGANSGDQTPQCTYIKQSGGP